MPLLRVLSLATVLLLSLASTPSLAASEVRLVRASAALNLGRTPTEGLTFDVLVKNLAYVKNLTLHIDNGTGIWTDIAGTYVRTIDDQTELWQVRLYYYSPASVTATYVFSLKYEVAGATYWDDNGGKNYALHVNSDGLLMQTPVLMEAANVDGASGECFGTVDVQNLTYGKKVTVVYTTDNWATTRSAAAQYAAGPWNDNGERWSFRLTGLGGMSGKSIEYAIAYDAGGVTYWDNNYGQNYTLNIP